MPTLTRPARALIGTAAAATLLLTGACANTNSAAQGAAGSASATANAVAPTGDLPEITGTTLVLRVDYTGGYVTPAMLATRLPMISVYADGRVITEGPTTKQYPGPALPNLRVHQLEAADVDKLVERARSAGVQNGVNLGQPPVADAQTTRFTLLTEQGVQTTEAYALAEATGADSGLTADQVRDRRLLSELITALQDLESTLGPGRVKEPDEYQPAEIAGVAMPWQQAEGDPAQTEVAWPGPALPGTSLGEGLDMGCVAATGQAAKDVFTAAKDATAITPWTSGGKRYTVQLRPLLPDEHDCDDLMKA
ncbi:hypothetical protein [Catenuloplanes atrovinosus]|uniref:Uncharacterized protein n=1 Tax=Catenuloplanes atrovinosus TaxID=137266 RepID=A0AAE3YKM5_9ACTN|nr:hypothetical protein [Catenuloplanes atrovinosus]MDR7274036.1 hypothetical protein [Catenuloplanes atrovinosus]